MKAQIAVDVNGISRYDFISEETGDQLKGCKCYYNIAATSDNSQGIVTRSFTANYEDYSLFNGVKFPVKVILDIDVSDLSKKPIIEKMRLAR